MEITRKEIENLILVLIRARNLTPYSGHRDYEYFQRQIIKLRKKWTNFV